MLKVYSEPELRAYGLELFKINWRKDGEKSKMERFYELFSYLLNNLIFSILVVKWIKLKLRSLKKGENFLVFVRQYGRR